MDLNTVLLGNSCKHCFPSSKFKYCCIKHDTVSLLNQIRIRRSNLCILHHCLTLHTSRICMRTRDNFDIFSRQSCTMSLQGIKCISQVPYHTDSYLGMKVCIAEPKCLFPNHYCSCSIRVYWFRSSLRKFGNEWGKQCKNSVIDYSRLRLDTRCTCQVKNRRKEMMMSMTLCIFLCLILRGN